MRSSLLIIYSKKPAIFYIPGKETSQLATAEDGNLWGNSCHSGEKPNWMVTRRSGQSICELEKVEPKFDTLQALKHVVEHHEKQPSHCQPSVGDSPTRASCEAASFENVALPAFVSHEGT